MVNTAEKQLPDDVIDAAGLIIKLKSGATPNEINVYGADTSYLIRFSKNNIDMVGTSNADGRIIGLEEMIRLHPVNDNGEINPMIHGLATGIGVYERLKAKFIIVDDTKVKSLRAIKSLVKTNSSLYLNIDSVDYNFYQYLIQKQFGDALYVTDDLKNVPTNTNKIIVINKISISDQPKQKLSSEDISHCKLLIETGSRLIILTNTNQDNFQIKTLTARCICLDLSDFPVST